MDRSENMAVNVAAEDMRVQDGTSQEENQELIPLFADMKDNDTTHESTSQSMNSSAIDGDLACDSNDLTWKRYEPKTGWSSQGFGDVQHGLEESFLQRKNFHSNRLKAKTTRRHERLRSQCPYDASDMKSNRTTTLKTVKSGPNSKPTVLEQFPPRKPISVLDALESLETMKLSKRIGFAKEHQVIE